MEARNRKQDQKKIRKKTYTKSDIVRIVMRLVGVLLMLGAGGYLCSVLLEYREGEAEYEALQEMVFSVPVESAPEENRPEENISEDNMPEENAPEKEAVEDAAPKVVTDEQIMQAVSKLRSQNDDVVGWIVFDNLDINYPIMQGADNNEYLRHTFSKKYNSAGSIFMESENTPDFEDCHTIIYGHNMKNLSMFGQLKYYKDVGFYDEHQYFTIYTEADVYRYQIFAYYDISATGDIYTIGFEHDEVFGEFVDNMAERSYYDTGVEATELDKVITLSTCTTSDENRFVVNAKRVESKKN